MLKTCGPSVNTKIRKKSFNSLFAQIALTKVDLATFFVEYLSLVKLYGVIRENTQLSTKAVDNCVS